MHLVKKPHKKPLLASNWLLLVHLMVATVVQPNIGLLAMLALAENNKHGTRKRTMKRRRAKICELDMQLGPFEFRRSYRMQKELFLELVNTIKPLLSIGRRRRHRHRVDPNDGSISPELRVSAALRYFGGGSVDDIMRSHGLSRSSLFVSVWAVVDAINKHPELAIRFPENHNKQRSIASGFQATSEAQFDCCVGAIDGMLVWTEKPSEKDCLGMKCGSGNFLCERKRKFGFNMQGICDAQGRFIDVWIINPASSSDYTAFTRSKLDAKLNRPGFLAEGLALFGDNAYKCTEYMVTPYMNVREGPKDDFNFYHSQVRSNIERAFGRLVQRWAILRRPLPSTMGVKKQICLAMALCKLHNFCLGEVNGDRLPRLSPTDELDIINAGGVEANY